MKRLWMALALACAANASADVSGTARLQGLAYTLYDLNPFDGVAPSLSWAPRIPNQIGGQIELHGESWIGDTRTDNTWVLRNASTGTAPATAEMHVPGRYQADASLTGRSDPSLFTLEVNAHVATAPGLRIGFARLGGDFATFNVGPGTGVVFTMLMSTQASVFYQGREHFNAYADLRLRMRDVDWEEADWQTYDLFSGGLDRPSEIDDIALLDVSYMNRTGLAQDGHLMMHLIAGGDIDSALPVPEPGGYAMLLAGLGVVGALGRKRRSAA